MESSISTVTLSKLTLLICCGQS
ncbi:hypothetical protein RDI58_021969 [Solanum bulbocastanum]|uniref:Uncharacterized protein n=1 Tax=Solanum bulbocastanum TaxID=147425 RepID=A0AAN8Y4T5_SOLBU